MTQRILGGIDFFMHKERLYTNLKCADAHVYALIKACSSLSRKLKEVQMSKNVSASFVCALALLFT